MLDRQPTLTGALVRLRPMEERDWAELYAVARDPEIWAMHPMHDRWKDDVFRAYFDYLMGEGGTLIVIDQANGRMCGSSSFSNLRKTRGGAVEIGSTFLQRSFWGLGHNREMKRLMLAHALAEVSLVEFLIGETNLRSRRAVEKIGAQLTDRTHEAHWPGGSALHVIYEIDRDGFASGPLNAQGSD